MSLWVVAVVQLSAASKKKRESGKFAFTVVFQEAEEADRHGEGHSLEFGSGLNILNIHILFTPQC